MPLDRRTPMPPALGSYSARPAIPPMTRPGAIRLAPRTHRPSSTLHHPSPATAAREHRPNPTTATPRATLTLPDRRSPNPPALGIRPPHSHTPPMTGHRARRPSSTLHHPSPATAA